MGLYTIPPTDPFNAFAETLGVWYDYVTHSLTSFVMGWVPAVPWMLAPSLISLVDLANKSDILSP